MSTVRARLDDLSERQQVLAIIVMAGLLLFATWFFLLLPQNRKRNQLRLDIKSMTDQLQQRNYLRGEPALQQELGSEQDEARSTDKEWSATALRMAAFADQQQTLSNPVGTIDYKVKLFEVRSSLIRKSRKANIGLPPDLGMEDAVRSNEDARKLMLQLRAVEKAVDLALDRKINLLRTIKPMPPIAHRMTPESEPFMEEYPVRLEFLGSIWNIYEMLEAILRSESSFALRNLRIDTASENDPNILRVRTTLSALVFLKTPDDLFGAMSKKPGRVRRPSF